MLCFLSIVEEFVELFGGDDLDLALSAVAVLDSGFGFAAGVVFAADEVVGVRLGATVPCATVGGDPIAERVAVGEPVWNGAANAKRESVDGRFGIDFCGSFDCDSRCDESVDEWPSCFEPRGDFCGSPFSDLGSDKVRCAEF